ncbi:hypothetical protein [Kibdelosporangium philippinense]|uniref:hypothetical protein n=1 Tax=Kibdelosporangium philippinense TaxID=211113 RepID=UPI0035E66312
MVIGTRLQRIAAVAGLVGAASLGVVSASGQAFAETQRATAPHATATAQVFYGPYSTYKECLDAQATVVEKGGTVLWKCGFISQDPYRWSFYAR